MLNVSAPKIDPDHEMHYFVKDINTNEIEEYSTLQEISLSLEWQDVAYGAYKIIDSSGDQYQWDKRRKDEVGTVYGYTLITQSRRVIL